MNLTCQQYHVSAVSIDELVTTVTLPDEDGKLVGADAVKFFERSGLHRDLLAKVSLYSLYNFFSRHLPLWNIRSGLT
jgi:hypothetical protein